MTHGDQAKAKAAKSSQASGSKKAGSKSGPGKAGKASKGAGTNGKSEKLSAKKEAAGEAKGRPSKGATQGKEGRQPAKAQARAPEPAVGFSNPILASAVQRAFKTYPNALRKLTD